MTLQHKLISILIGLAIQSSLFGQVTQTEYTTSRIDSNSDHFESEKLEISMVYNHPKAKHEILINFDKGTVHFKRRYHKSDPTNVSSASHQWVMVHVRKLKNDLILISCEGVNFIFDFSNNIAFNDQGPIRKFEGEGLTITQTGSIDSWIR